MTASVERFELSAVDLPFRVSFKHSAAERRRSESLFLKCVTDGGPFGGTGFGESLPREYVTGESRDGAFELLAERVLPRLAGRSFAGLAEVETFLGECDGRAPADWVDPSTPQGARMSAAPFEKATRDPTAAQEALLRRMMANNRDTEYGREHGFAAVRSLDDYRSRVPVVDYEDIRGHIDRMTRGEKGVLTDEDPVLFAQTSGTTGTPKYIPVTPTCQLGGGMTTWLHYARRDHPGMFRDKIVTIVSPAIEGHTEGGLPFGSTSGMVVKEMPKIVQSAYAVPYDVYEIHDYEAKYYALLRLGLGRSVSFIGTANPSSILKLAEMADANGERLIRDLRDGTLSDEVEIQSEVRRVIEGMIRPDPGRAGELEAMRGRRDGKLLPADYWPHMALLGCWKGGTVGAYVDKLGAWYDPNQQGMVPVRDMGYLASEARMSIPVSDDGAGGVLTIHLNVFEFVPVEEVDDRPDEPGSWSFLGATELEIGRDYYVFVTTTGGLYRYDMNDVVERVDTYNATPVIVFRRKGRGMTNLTGEKLSVNQVIAAMGKAGEAVGVGVGHFRAEPDVSRSLYVFKVEFESALPAEKRFDFLGRLDESLGELNIEYQAKRASGRLGPPVLQVMRSGWYERGKQSLVAEGKRLFQAKTVLLDAKSGYRPEPDELEAEVGLVKGRGVQ